MTMTTIYPSDERIPFINEGMDDVLRVGIVFFHRQVWELGVHHYQWPLLLADKMASRKMFPAPAATSKPSLSSMV